MATNKLSMARVAVGAIEVGSAPGMPNRPSSPTPLWGVFLLPGPPSGTNPNQANYETTSSGYSIAWGTVAAAEVTEKTVTATGVRPGDVVIALPPANLPAGVMLGQAYVSANDTVTIPIINPTAAGIVVGTNNWYVLWIKLNPNG